MKYSIEFEGIPVSDGSFRVMGTENYRSECSVKAVVSKNGIDKFAHTLKKRGTGPPR